MELYRQAAQRGAQWLMAQQNSDGSFIRPDIQADVYHKGAFALGISGHVAEAMRLLNWIKANDLAEGGRLRHFDAGLALYKTSWICQGAHRLARFDISLAVIEYILSCQAPCGGFFQVVEGSDYVEPVCSSWAGMSCVYAGRLEAARLAANCLLSTIEQQPSNERFYYWMSPDGKLATEDAPISGNAPFIDATKPQQAYYCSGIIGLFLARLYQATGDQAYLEGAKQVFDFSLRCAEDAYAYPPSGKSAVGAAVLHTITGDPRAKSAALTFAEYLLQEQSPEGWWKNPHADDAIVRLDHTAEFVVWLNEIVAALGGAEDGG
jgi:hypothetical protein